MTRRPKQPLPTENLVPSATDANAIVLVKVWLLGISSMVWRRVLVPSACTLRERLDALTAELDKSRGGAQVSQERAEAIERADDARRARGGRLRGATRTLPFKVSCAFSAAKSSSVPSA